MSNNIAFVLPLNPENMLTIPANSTENQEAALIRKYFEGRREHLLYENTRKALVKVIIECVEKEFIADLKDENMGFEDYSVM